MKKFLLAATLAFALIIGHFAQASAQEISLGENTAADFNCTV